MEGKITKNYKFSLSEVKDMVADFLRKKGELGSLDSLKIDSVTKSTEIPGCDPHDCDYAEVFDGLAVIVEQEMANLTKKK